ncbi:hypothetical protein RCO48_20675 [Peribacillus frigoritolerans]|nr:hypothetical protein [Peribacillus frigoritolerans]
MKMFYTSLTLVLQVILAITGKRTVIARNTVSFYSDAFKTLTIHGKRLLLMGAFRMSVLKSEEVLFDYHEIVPDSSSPFTRQRLLDAVAAIHDALGHIVTISFASRAFSIKEVLVFTFTEGVLEEYKENRAERTLLRRTIFNSGYLGHINDSVCRELEQGRQIYFPFISARSDEHLP